MNKIIEGRVTYTLIPHETRHHGHGQAWSLNERKHYFPNFDFLPTPPLPPPPFSIVEVRLLWNVL